MAKTPQKSELDPGSNPGLDDGDDENMNLVPPVPISEEAIQKRIDAAVEAAVAETLKKAIELAEAQHQAIEQSIAAPVTKKVTIILEESDDIPPTGLFIGVNGRSYMLRPGEEVTIPEEVVHALNDAVMSTPKTDLQGNVVDYRNRLRFPYRIISGSL